MKILLITTHPNFEKSIANKTIVAQLETDFADIEIRNLDKLYPDYQIDISAEQEALIAADIVVLQYPFYWYSVPGMLKLWMDKVLSYGFAYGTGGDQLKGKYLLQSLTVGGAKESYHPNGYNHFKVEEFLRPIEQTAYLAQMKYQEPVYTFRNFQKEGVWNSESQVSAQAMKHATVLKERIRAITSSKKAAVKEFVSEWFRHFDTLDGNGYFVQYLAPEVQMKFPDSDAFTGHDGFHSWYNETKSGFEGTTTHDVQNLKVREVARHHFEIDMEVALKGTMTTGAMVDLTVAESWTLHWDELSDRPVIDRYLVSLKK
jgi:putative NADPH-quinone reductase